MRIRSSDAGLEQLVPRIGPRGHSTLPCHRGWRGQGPKYSMTRLDLSSQHRDCREECDDRRWRSHRPRKPVLAADSAALIEGFDNRCSRDIRPDARSRSNSPWSGSAVRSRAPRVARTSPGVVVVVAGAGCSAAAVAQNAETGGGSQERACLHWSRARVCSAGSRGRRNDGPPSTPAGGALR